MTSTGPKRSILGNELSRTRNFGDTHLKEPPTKTELNALPGHMLKGFREIGAFLGVSASTANRWHVQFRGQTDPALTLPAYQVPTGRGNALRAMSSISLITLWMQRWSTIDTLERQNRPKGTRRRRLGAKSLAMGESGGAPSARVETASPREAFPALKPSQISTEVTRHAGRGSDSAPRDPVAQPAPAQQFAIPCTCGTPEPCNAH